MRVNHNIKISLGFLCITLLIIFTANFIGLIPDKNESIFRERISLTESLAIQFSVAIQQNNISTLPVTTELVVKRNPQVKAIILRSSDEKVFASYGDAELNVENAYSTINHMKVPLFINKTPWGLVEIIFQPPKKTIGFSFIDSTFVRLIIFIGVFGFILYFILVRKLLQYLDPHKVIPQRVKKALNAVSDGMVFIDDSGRIVLTNTAFEDKLEVEMNSITGKGLSDMEWIIPGNDTNNSKLPWQKTLASGDNVTHIPLNIDTLSGNRLTFVINSTPLQDNNGIIRGALVSFNDVTELEKMNFELESMTKFLRHEMSNALMSATGTVTLLEKSMDLSDVDKQLVNRTQQLHLVIKNILESVKEAKSIESSFSREDTKPQNIVKILSDIVSNYADIYNGNTFEFVSDNNELLVVCQEERIIQMIDKLTTNAIDHSEAGTSIIYSCKSDSGFVHIKISNEGNPLPADKEKIFDLFATFRNQEVRNENQGIGLYVVKLIAETYGGSVSAKDRKEVTGAEFTIRLPLINSGSK